MKNVMNIVNATTNWLKLENLHLYLGLYDLVILFSPYQFEFEFFE